jgi:XapX domain-containing protein
MKTYVVSLGAGILVGIIYALLNVRSPAPPIVALVGLLGILVGEQLPPLVKQAVDRTASVQSWLHDQVKPHCFGELPGATNAAAASTDGDVSQGERHG